MPTTTRDPKSSLKPSTGEERRCQVSTRGPGMSGELWLWGMALFFSGASGRESHHPAGAPHPHSGRRTPSSSSAMPMDFH